MENGKLAAFPREWSSIKQSKDAPELIAVAQNGLTKREYFAAMALQGLSTIYDLSIDRTVEISVEMADKLLEQLEKTK